ncbi:MAG: phosphoribosylformylglycinamidine synthase subunit PurQ [Pseudomonadota bacterium]
MRAAILIYPGTNRGQDVADALHSFDITTILVSCMDRDLPKCDLVILPGGFSFGDYLRSGALASVTPIMQAVKTHSQRGGYVLGICNGFQILTEAGLLPGFLMRNASLRFICDQVVLKTHGDSIFVQHYHTQPSAKIPIAHLDGNYQCDERTLAMLQDEGQIAFTYLDNPNGSIADIAGITDKRGRILGMMPHFENAVLDHQAKLNQATFDGRLLFSALRQIAC